MMAVPEVQGVTIGGGGSGGGGGGSSSGGEAGLYKLNYVDP
jgi:hypothetical protein